MLIDDEWIKNYAMCLKKFKEKSERKIYGLDLDLRILIVVMQKQLCFVHNHNHNSDLDPSFTNFSLKNFSQFLHIASISLDPFIIWKSYWVDLKQESRESMQFCSCSKLTYINGEIWFWRIRAHLNLDSSSIPLYKHFGRSVELCQGLDQAIPVLFSPRGQKSTSLIHEIIMWLL